MRVLCAPYGADDGSPQRRRIVAACLETRVAAAVRAYAPSCFAACPQPTNASTQCVARCYMHARIVYEPSVIMSSSAEFTKPWLVLQSKWSGCRQRCGA